MADRITQETVEVALQPVINARVTQEFVEVGVTTSARSLTTQVTVEVAYKPASGRRRLKVIQT